MINYLVVHSSFNQLSYLNQVTYWTVVLGQEFVLLLMSWEDQLVFSKAGKAISPDGQVNQMK